MINAKNLNKIYSILFIVLIIALLIGLTACKPAIKTVAKTTATVNASKCTTDEDCIKILGKTLKKCNAAYCTVGICKSKVLTECCGNNITEEIENNKTGSKCTCPADYGACNATVKFEDKLEKMVAAKYITRTCDSKDKCIVIYDEQAQRNTEFFNIWTSTGFTINIYAKYPNPFFMSDSAMEVEFKLNDYDVMKVYPPIIINEVRIMEGSTILVKTNPGITLEDVSETRRTVLVMTNYDFVYPEEYKTVTFSIDYEYVPLIKTPDLVNKGQYTYEEAAVERRTYTVPLREKMVFLDKSLIVE